MIACLRSARFLYRDGSASVCVELRRHHNTDAQADNKTFSVTKRLSRLPGAMTVKHFGTLPEARRYWMTEVARFENRGMERRDARIMGFHEED